MKLEIPSFQDARLLVIGDVMLDRYWHGSANRISPEAPVPVIKVANQEDRPGGAGNVALNISALGSATRIIGVVGEDESGTELESRLTAAGVLCDFIHCPGKPTITKLRVISQHQQLIRADFEQAFEKQDVISLLTKAKALVSNTQAMVLSDYAKGSLQEIAPLIKLGRDHGIPVIVDPKGSDFDKYRGATLITPNLNEFEAVVGHCANETDLVAKGMQLVSDLELEAILITRGEHGMTAISGPELRRAILGEQDSGQGVMTSDQLAIAVEDARAHGERIVFTNGCFDIIHAGHVGYLNEARKLGERLVVAINDDDSVRRLKGPGRPINPVERRMAVLAGLEAVDWVVSFSEDTPETLLQSLKPETLVKGGDYAIDQVVGGEFVLTYGGKVQALEFLDNCSTSDIVEKMRRVGD